MAGASGSHSALLLLLLLLAVAATATAGTAAEAPTAALEEEKSLLQISGCLRSITEVPGCSAEVMRSFLTARLQLGTQCCRLINDLDGSCFLRIFSWIPFTSVYPAAIRSYCAMITS